MSDQSEHALHLSDDQLAAHLERRLHGAEREAVVAHLVDCAECRREYVAAGTVVGAAPRKWANARTGITLAVAAVVVFAIVPRAFRPSATTVAQDAAATQRASVPDVPAPIRLAAPTDGERLTGADVRLAWHPDGKDGRYAVTVQAADAAVVWKTETYDTTLTLPPSVHLTRGATYYWIVDALHADGRTARSPANTFTR